MSLQEARSSYKQLLRDLGQGALNALFPDDFEFYLCAFELRDSNDKLKSMLIFPVNPESIREQETNPVNIMKTFNGVVTITNPTFNPFPITISGTFGRKLRIVLNTGGIADATAFFDTDALTPSFNPKIKTGYGTLQLLRKMLRKSKKIDPKTGLPYKLYFFNYALNSSYMVEYNTMVSDMSIQKNALWYYSIQMTAIAELKNPFSQRLKLLGLSIGQTFVNNLANELRAESDNIFKSTKSFN